MRRSRVAWQETAAVAAVMKVVVGSPGTWSGLLLRTGQCVFAGASIGVMVSALEFSNYTAFWYGLDFFASFSRSVVELLFYCIV